MSDSSGAVSPASPNSIRNRPYDYLLKFLLVGDSDVGKEEILCGLDDGASESPYGCSNVCGKYEDELSISFIFMNSHKTRLQL